MCDSLKVKFISSLEKCFLDEKFEEKPELKSISMLNNEHLSVQLLMNETDLSLQTRRISKVKVVSALADCITLPRKAGTTTTICAKPPGSIQIC